MSDTYASLDDKPFDSHYMLEEIDIDRPVEHVWPFAVAIGGWMDAHGLETISGSPTELGHFERVHPKSVGPDTPEPRYHTYGIGHLIPHKYIALEVMPERGGSYGNPRDWVSFDGVILNDLGDGRTRITFLFIDMHAGKGGAEEYAERSKELEGAREMLKGYLRHLKEQAEA